jgi:hypothetical protein
MWLANFLSNLLSLRMVAYTTSCIDEIYEKRNMGKLMFLPTCTSKSTQLEKDNIRKHWSKALNKP